VVGRSVLRELALQKGSNIVEGNLVGDHVHMLISIPPKYAVSQVVGYVKGKSAINIARTYAGRQKNFTGQIFWPKVTMYQLQVVTKRQFVATYRSRNN